MKMIDKMLEDLEEEVEGAREYAERYIECKARGNISRANRYKEMATDELNHAMNLRDMYVADVEGLKSVYTMTEAEQSKWEHANKHLTEQLAMVKHILAM